MTLSAWVAKYTAEECGLSPASMRSKRNAQARVEEYLLYIGKPDFALADVDKDFCKDFIAFLKTCTFNNGKKTLSSTTCRYEIVKKAFLFSCFTFVALTNVYLIINKLQTNNRGIGNGLETTCLHHFA